MLEEIAQYLRDNMPISIQGTPVITFGTADDPPSAPYIVVKDNGSVINGGGYLIIFHEMPARRRYLRRELGMITGVLRDAEVTDQDGNVQQLYALDDESAIIGDNDDGSISKDRLFMVFRPSIL